ncbi:MAG: lipid A-modifier LpxR family protein, partial [Rhodoplanes sp.]
DGNTFVSSPSVNHQVFVADLVAGAEIFTQYGSRVAFTVTKRTQEFSSEPGGGDLFGSIEARVQF